MARYVPKPRPGVFRITKTMHNILQGVSKPHEIINAEEKKMLVEWIEENANRYWLSPGGPLRPPEEGGADVIVVSIWARDCIKSLTQADRRPANARLNSNDQESNPKQTSPVPQSHPDPYRLGRARWDTTVGYLAVPVEQD